MSLKFSEWIETSINFGEGIKCEECFVINKTIMVNKQWSYFHKLQNCRFCGYILVQEKDNKLNKKKKAKAKAKTKKKKEKQEQEQEQEQEQKQKQVQMQSLVKSQSAEEDGRGEECLEIHEIHHGLKKRCVDPLPSTRALSGIEGGQHPLGQKSSPGRIRNGDPRAPGTCSSRARDAHQPAHALNDLIQCWPLGVGAVLAKTRKACVDEPGIELRKRGVVHGQAVLDPRAEIFNENIRTLDQSIENRPPPLAF
jgi:hypothetical protein